MPAIIARIVQSRIPEIERNSSLEISTGELLKYNPAALIVNRESYQRMEANFATEQWESPQVARVRIFTQVGRGSIRYFVVDGLTRTKYVDDHTDEIKSRYPKFRFQAKDVTGALLKNSLVTPPTERLSAQKELTMLQYLRAVVPPTIVHAEIAPDRIALHLIGGWGNLVGQELAAKFSATAAMNFLKNPRVPLTPGDLRRFLSKQEKLIAIETPEERLRLESGLLEIAAIIVQTKLHKEQVAESVFNLVSTGSPVIGGIGESQRQIYGLLYSNLLEHKLISQYPDLSQRERIRTEIGEIAVRAMAKFQNEEARARMIPLINVLFERTPIEVRQILDILASDSPMEKYNETLISINKNRVTEAYRKLFSVQGRLSESEEKLITRLGGTVFIEEHDIRYLCSAVRDAAGTLVAANNRMESLKKEREKLEAQGVSSQTIDSAIKALEDGAKDLLAVNGHKRLTFLHNELANKSSYFSREITRQINLATANTLINKFHKINPSRSMEDIRMYIQNQTPTLESAEVKRSLSLLSQFDSDIQSKLIRGDVTIGYAQQLQRQRQRQDKAKEAVPLRPAKEVGAPGEAPKWRIAPEVIVERRVARQKIEVTLQRRAEDAESKRKQEANGALMASAEDFLTLLESLDPRKEDIEPETRAPLEKIMVTLGKLIFDHPDIVRVLRKDYPKLLKEKSARLSAETQQKEADTSKDSL